MRKDRSRETDEQRQDRVAENARRQTESDIAADKALDAMVKRSIEQHGP